ncbi:MAG: hypothetical protein ACYCPT_00980 [Acidimicrobiales bacterium]
MSHVTSSNPCYAQKPKTPGSRRTLATPEPLITAINHHREQQDRERLLVDDKWINVDLVAASEVGSPWTPSTHVAHLIVFAPKQELDIGT